MKVARVELQRRGDGSPFGWSCDAYLVKIGNRTLSCYRSKVVAQEDADELNAEIKKLLGTDNIHELQEQEVEDHQLC